MKPNTRLVLDMLSKTESLCASAFLDRGIARYSARIFELRNLHDYVISMKPCRTHDHPHGPVYRYKLEGRRAPVVQVPAEQLTIQAELR